jgi:hypothetical protein
MPNPYVSIINSFYQSPFWCILIHAVLSDDSHNYQIPIGVDRNMKSFHAIIG